MRTLHVIGLVAAGSVAVPACSRTRAERPVHAEPAAPVPDAAPRALHPSSTGASATAASASAGHDAGAVDAAPEGLPPAPVMEELTLHDGKPAFFFRRAATAHDAGPQEPLVVYLHGACITPEWECPFFAGATTRAWLLCPGGPAPCPDWGGLMWAGSTPAFAKAVDDAVVALEVKAGADRFGPRALVGYSLGGPAALRIALHEPGRWQRLMIVNANVVPNPRQLAKAGIERIALVAGQRDAVAPKLRRGAAWLARNDIDVRYFVLSDMAHYYEPNSARQLQEPLAWLTAEWPRR